MRKSKYFIVLAQWIVALFLPIVLLLSILQLSVFDLNFYRTAFQKYHIASVTKISSEDLDRITLKIMRYLKDEEQDLTIQAKIQGTPSEVFGNREKQHMVDVKKLFQKGYQLRNIGILFCILSIIAFMNDAGNRKEKILKSVCTASLLSLLGILLLFIAIQIDFYRYFIYFHKIFFQNNLWQLNPEEDVLIQMFPLAFFSDMAAKVIQRFMGLMWILGILSFVQLRKEGRSKK